MSRNHWGGSNEEDSGPRQLIYSCENFWLSSKAENGKETKHKIYSNINKSQFHDIVLVTTENKWTRVMEARKDGEEKGRARKGGKLSNEIKWNLPYHDFLFSTFSYATQFHSFDMNSRAHIYITTREFSFFGHVCHVHSNRFVNKFHLHCKYLLREREKRKQKSYRTFIIC